MNALDNATLNIDALIDELKGHEYMSGDTNRRHKGQDEIFTPMPAVFYLLDAAKELVGDDKFDKIIGDGFTDPTCGDGNMLVGVLIYKLEKMKREKGDTEITWDEYKTLIFALRGRDIDPKNIEVFKERIRRPWYNFGAKEVNHKTKNINKKIFVDDYFKEEKAEAERKEAKAKAEAEAKARQRSFFDVPDKQVCAEAIARTSDKRVAYGL